MEINTKKNVLLMCANVDCHHMATHFLTIQKNEVKKMVGLCENCSLELNSTIKKGGSK